MYSNTYSTYQGGPMIMQGVSGKGGHSPVHSPVNTYGFGSGAPNLPSPFTQGQTLPNVQVEAALSAQREFQLSSGKKKDGNGIDGASDSGLFASPIDGLAGLKLGESEEYIGSEHGRFREEDDSAVF